MTEFVNRRQPGEPVGQLQPHNQLIDVANRANNLSVVYPLELHNTAAGLQLRLAQREVFKHVSLAEDVAPGDTDKAGHVLDYDATNSQFVDTTTDSSFTDQSIHAVTDSQDGGIYLKHERHLCYFDPENAKYLPVSGPTWHLGIADSAIAAGGSGTVSIWKVDLDDDDIDLNASEHIDSTLDVTAYDLFGTGLSAGDELMVFFHGQSRRWYAMRTSATTIVRFETTGTKTLGGNVIGEKLLWDGAAYATDGTTIGLVDYLGAFGPKESGAWGWAVRMPDYGTVTIDSVEYDAYEIISMNGKAGWIAGTLTEDMGATNADEATATATDYWGNPSHGIAPPVGAGAITVHDPQQQFTRALEGAEFLAVLDERGDEYNLVRCETKAIAIDFTLTTEFTAGTASATVNDYYRGQNPDPGSEGILVKDPQGLWTTALEGAKGHATYDDRSDEYHVLECQTQAKVVTFTLTEDMGETTANEASCTLNDYYHGQNPGTTGTVSDPQQLFTRALSGAKGKALYDDRSNEYHIVECQIKAKSITFTLDEAIGDTTAAEAKATVNDYYRGQDPSDGSGDVQVQDEAGRYARARTGAKGTATYDDTSDEYHITDCEVEVTAYIGKLVGALASSDTTKGVDDLEAMGDGQTRRVDATTSITANNIFSGEGDDNSLVLIRYNQKDDDWDIITGACPT